MDAFRDFAPQAVVSDAEPWTHAIAKYHRIPRISFDHFGVLAHCRPEMRWIDRLLTYRDVWVYRRLIGRPERVLVSSFYDAPAIREGVRVVPTLLRREVLEVRPADGEHILAYFNKGMHLFTKRIEQALRGLDCPVLVYGTRRLGTEGNLQFRPRGNRAFLEALASCRAVVSTAGNQLVGEAVHYGKPMLVIPEDCVEQRVNAKAIEQNGFGVQVSQRRVTTAVVREFLRRADEFRTNLNNAGRDGLHDAIDALEGFLRELTGESTQDRRSHSVA